MNKVSSFQLSAAVRDAIGLSADQKAFLWNITSHQSFEEFSSREKLRQRTGLTDWKLRRTIESLEAAGLIKVERRPGTTTKYRIRYAAVRELKDPDNALAVATKASRKQPMAVSTKTPSGSAQRRQGGVRQDVRVGTHHQKINHEEGTEKTQKNGRDEGARKRVVRIVPRRNRDVGDATDRQR